MRWTPDSKFWVVTDPGESSEIADICFESSLRSLERQFRGGLTIGENPTLFDARTEAESEAHLRMVAMRASRAIADAAPQDRMREAARVALLAEDGTVLFESGLR